MANYRYLAALVAVIVMVHSATVVSGSGKEAAEFDSNRPPNRLPIKSNLTEDFSLPNNMYSPFSRLSAQSYSEPYGQSSESNSYQPMPSSGWSTSESQKTRHSSSDVHENSNPPLASDSRSKTQHTFDENMWVEPSPGRVELIQAVRKCKVLYPNAYYTETNESEPLVLRMQSKSDEEICKKLHANTYHMERNESESSSDDEIPLLSSGRGKKRIWHRLNGVMTRQEPS